MKRLALLVLSVVMASSVVPAQAENWTSPFLPPDSGLVGWQLVDRFNFEGSVSWLKQNTKDADPNAKQEAEWRLCVEPGVAPCTRADGTYDANISLPYCATEKQEWCIEAIAMTPSGARKIPGEFIRNVAGPTTNAVKSLNIPKGSTAGLWRIKGVKHSGNVDTYATLVNLRFVKSAKDREPFIAYMDARVLPYREVTGASSRTNQNYEALSVAEFFDDATNNWLAGISGGSEECAWTASNLCGLIEDFPAKTNISVTLRIGKRVTGWLMGRLENPVVNVSPFNSSQNKLTIDAKPVDVPIFYSTVNPAELTEAMRKTFMVDGFEVDNPEGIWSQKGNSFQAFDVIPAWKDAAKDTAVALTRTWSFATTSNGSGSKCLENTDKLLGLVTTNATAYEGTAPNFVDDTLDYKVAGMHFNPDGSEFQGRYDLVMLKSVAQCLYGFKDAPISATITVLNNGAEAKVATASLVETGSGSNKWLKLSAQGFTFSNPIVRVKLTQDATQTVKAGTTITCIQGKKTKKVTGPNPKCPTGYKKK